MLLVGASALATPISIREENTVDVSYYLCRGVTAKNGKVTLSNCQLSPANCQGSGINGDGFPVGDSLGSLLEVGSGDSGAGRPGNGGVSRAGGDVGQQNVGSGGGGGEDFGLDVGNGDGQLASGNGVPVNRISSARPGIGGAGEGVKLDSGSGDG